MNASLTARAAAVAILVATAGCGSDSRGSTASQPDGAAAATTASVPDDLEIAGAVTVPSIASDSETPAELIRMGVPTTAGTTYALDGLAGPALDVTITDPSGGRFGYVFTGTAGIGLAADLSAQLVDIFSLSATSVHTDALVDFADITGPSAMSGLFERSPTDFLSWMSTRPGVTPGPIADTTFAGWPATTMTYDVGEVEGALPCYPDGRGCLASVTDAHLSGAYVDFEGTTVTLYQVKIAGLTIVVVVSELPGAAELAATITLKPTAAPPGADGAVALERMGQLSSDSRYYWAGSSFGTYTFAGSEAIRVGRGDPSVAWVDFFADGELPCLSIVDGTQAVMLEEAADGSSAEAGPVTAEFSERVATDPRLDVVQPTSPVTLGDVDAVSIDVTPTTDIGMQGVNLIGFGIPLRSGATYRIVALSRSSDGAPDIVMLELGTACAAVLDDLTVTPAA